MDDHALNKLISDIQDFLREQDGKATAVSPSIESTADPQHLAAPRTLSRAIQRSARAARLLEMCAYGWAVFITSVILWFAWKEQPATFESIQNILLLCTFGLFTTLALIAGAHRIATLLRIEKNTREILRLRRRQNAILSRLLDRE